MEASESATTGVRSVVNFWRDLEAGVDPPDKIFVVVEMTRGSQNKYEYDRKLSCFSLDRVLYSFFPCDYGFIPQTLDEDGDPLDAILLIDQSTFPGCVVSARPVGVMTMLDEGRKDDKIVAVAVKDPRHRHIGSVRDVPKPIVDELTHFFNSYKLAEKKKTEVLKWMDVGAAKTLIRKAMRLYVKE